MCACSEQAPQGGEFVARAAPAPLVDGNGNWVDPVVGPEIGTDKPVPVATTLGSNPSLSTDGNGFLAVQVVGTDIRGTRVDGNGNILDLNWINLGESGIEQYNPDVVYGGGPGSASG